MPEITAIKPQKNQKRVNIYLDGKFAFGLDLENLMKFGLKVKQELSRKDIKEIVKKTLFQKTLDKLLRFTSLRPRSEKEIKDWLRRKKVHQSLQKELLKRLKRLDLLDDRKFAKWWIEQRLTFRPRGLKVLKSELFQKGIHREIVDEAISSIRINEVRIAKGLLEKKKYRWEKLPKIEAMKKKSEFLLRKGFSWDIIKKIVD